MGAMGGWGEWSDGDGDRKKEGVEVGAEVF